MTAEEPGRASSDPLQRGASGPGSSDPLQRGASGPASPASPDEPGTADRHPRDRLSRQLSLTDTTFLVVASVVGSGIFLTPGEVSALLPNVGLFFGAWVVGALLSLAGALANAELGSMYPRAGGDYVFLREAFHPLAGFLVGWLTFFVIFAGTIAALAAGFSASFGQLLGWGDTAQVALAVGLVIATSAINYVGVRWGARANNVSTALKIGALVLFAVAGFASGSGSAANLAVSPLAAADVPFTSFGLALSPILFSFLGWNATIYVASEVRNPARNVPRSLFLGLAIVTGIYLAMNGLYLYAMPLGDLSGAANAGESAAHALFGRAGGTLVAVLVLVSILGTLNATILVGPRIAYAMALDGLFFRGVDRTHAAFQTPTVAIGVQAIAAVGLLLVLRSFPSALDYTTFAILLATMADVAALYALRRRKPGHPRPYRAWGYPVVPALYLAANATIAGVMLVNRPLECGIGLGILAMGLPFYLLFVRRAGSAVGPEASA